jgi:hypothetical protein
LPSALPRAPNPPVTTTLLSNSDWDIAKSSCCCFTARTVDSRLCPDEYMTLLENMYK